MRRREIVHVHSPPWTNIFDISRTACSFFMEKKRAFSVCLFQSAPTNTCIFTFLHSRFFHQIPVWKITKIKTLFFKYLRRDSLLGRIHPATLLKTQNFQQKLYILYDILYNSPIPNSCFHFCK